MVELNKIKENIKEKWTDVLFFTIFIILLIGQIQVTLGKPVTLLALVAVESNSMVPTFQRGDILLISRKNQIKEGEIILFDAGVGTPIVHRVIEVVSNENCERCFVTKGDNNPVTDEVRLGLIKREQVLAEVVSTNRYIFKLPKLGYLSLWIRGR